LAWWDNVLHAVERIGDWLGGQRDDIPEETDEEPGGFFGGEEPPEEPPSSAGFGGDEDNRDYFTYYSGNGPYLDEWGDAEIRFWDRVANEHMFFGESNYNEAQRQFELGFIEQDIDTDERTEAREDFLEEMLLMTMDWDAFEDYYSET
jgi:hypothetical protein